MFLDVGLRDNYISLIFIYFVRLPIPILQVNLLVLYEIVNYTRKFDSLGFLVDSLFSYKMRGTWFGFQIWVIS